jgi:hypothetical protein
MSAIAIQNRARSASAGFISSYSNAYWSAVRTNARFLYFIIISVLFGAICFDDHIELQFVIIKTASEEA